jgi:hypothetical protein
VEVTPRPCGDCDLCCSVMGIIELEKPAATRCPHQCGGCSIYGSHPPTCQSFECLWRQGAFKDEHQPNKLGLIFFSDPDNAKIIHCLVDHERLDCWREPEAMKVISAISGKFVVLIGSQRLIAFATPHSGVVYTAQKSPHLFNGMNLSPLGQALIEKR